MSNYQSYPPAGPQRPLEQPRTNGLGLAGFIISIVGLLLCWLPIISWVIWVPGLILSIAGICSRPRGLGICGLVISIIALLLMLLFTTILTAFTAGMFAL